MELSRTRVEFPAATRKVGEDPPRRETPGLDLISIACQANSDHHMTLTFDICKIFSHTIRNTRPGCDMDGLLKASPLHGG